MQRFLAIAALAVLLVYTAEARRGGNRGPRGPRSFVCKITGPIYESEVRECPNGEACDQSLTLTGADGDVVFDFCASSNITAFVEKRASKNCVADEPCKDDTQVCNTNPYTANGIELTFCETQVETAEGETRSEITFESFGCGRRGGRGGRGKRSSTTTTTVEPVP